MIPSLLYLASIVGVNVGFVLVPLVATPWGDMWPPMSLVVGLVFVLRDYAQRAIGHRVLFVMGVALALSWWLASPAVAVASAAAFLCSELADWAVYTWRGGTFRSRVLWSSAIGTPIDSCVFLALIGHFSVTGAGLMTLSKMLAALLIWRAIRDPLPRHPDHAAA